MRRPDCEDLEHRLLLASPGISISDASAEVGGLGTVDLGFVASLSQASSRTVTVNYSTVGSGTAVVGSVYGDYRNTSGTLTFAPGEQAKMILVPAFGAQGPRPEKVFFVALSGPVNATLDRPVGTGTIDNRGTGTLSVDDAVVNRGQSGTFDLVFNVHLDRAVAVPVTVAFSTASNGTAVPDIDYRSTIGTLTFAPGETSKSVDVPVLGAPGPMFDRVLTFRLSGPQGATVGRNTGVGFIRDDGGTLSVSPETNTPGGSSPANATFAVNLSAAVAQPVTVDFTTVGDGTATPGVDYVSTTGRLTFAPGDTTRTITVPVLGNRTAIGDRSYSVVLSHATNALLINAAGVGKIQAPLLKASGSDDTAAIQALLDRGQTVRLAAGQFYITRTLNLTANGQQLIGAGQDATTITCRGDFLTAVGATGLDRVAIRDLAIDCNRAGRQAILTSRTIGIFLSRCSDSTVERCLVQGTVGGPVVPGSSLKLSGEGIVMYGDRDAVLGCSLRDLGVLVPGSEYLTSDGAFVSGEGNIIKDCVAQGVTDTAFVLEDGDRSGVMDCKTTGCNAGVGISNARNVPGIGNYAHNIEIDDWNAEVTGGISISTPRPDGTGNLVDTSLRYIHLSRIAGLGPGINVRRTGTARVDGLSIRDVTIDGSGTQGLLIDGANIEVADCAILNTSWTGIQIQPKSQNVSIRACRIVNPSAFGVATLAPINQVSLADNLIQGGSKMNWGIFSFGSTKGLTLRGNTIRGFQVGDVGAG